MFLFLLQDYNSTSLCIAMILFFELQAIEKLYWSKLIYKYRSQNQFGWLQGGATTPIHLCPQKQNSYTKVYTSKVEDRARVYTSKEKLLWFLILKLGNYQIYAILFFRKSINLSCLYHRDCTKLLIVFRYVTSLAPDMLWCAKKYPKKYFSLYWRLNVGKV